MATCDRCGTVRHSLTLIAGKGALCGRCARPYTFSPTCCHGCGMPRGNGIVIRCSNGRWLCQRCRGRAS